MKSQSEAKEMWFLRRMLRIAWTDKVSNEEVLKRANTSRNLKVIVNRQIRFVEHTHREKESVGSDRVDRDDRRQKS